MIWIVLACTQSEPSTELQAEPLADIFVDTLGKPVPFLEGELLERFYRGAEIMERSFHTDGGLGPFFNADSCASCHQGPVAGGSGPKYRDLWLVKEERWDGALINAGTNGESPVRNLYATPPTFHVQISDDVDFYARRNTPSGFGVGLFAFIDEDALLASADPEDRDGDEISGRVNYEQGLLGRFGYKSQAATMESFNRGAMFNQMGITSDPLFYEFPEEHAMNIENDWSWGISSAWAQVSAPDEPTIDDDGTVDPEMNNEDQLDLLIFSTYLGVLPFQDEPQGKKVFYDIGCLDCHTASIPSKIGRIPAFSDLLIHDMGEELADGLQVGFASGSEFRTQPLWGVALHGPYLHDGRADTLREAIEWHGGEATRSRDKWLMLSGTEQNSVIRFLEGLGGASNGGLLLEEPNQLPAVGENGGPVENLTEQEQEEFAWGAYLFDTSITAKEGLGAHFNADSCRACHQDPVLGGAGGLDVNVLRVGYRDEDGVYSDVSYKILSRTAQWDTHPLELDMTANVIEGRNPPSILGLGIVDALSSEDILAFSDPEDMDGDGISGRPNILPDGRLGRFGWKANIPTLQDFVADAMLNEMGMTVHPSLSGFTVANDQDSCPDPELENSEFQSLLFYLQHLSPPIPQLGSEEEGRQIFIDVGCHDCHRMELPGYSDYLLHDVAPNPLVLVEQDPGVDPSEYRTAPLWGIVDTGPYLHDGSASTIEKSIEQGHFGEATRSRNLYFELSEVDKELLLKFINSL